MKEIVILSEFDAEKWSKAVSFDDIVFIPDYLVNPRILWLFLDNMREETSVIFNYVSCCFSLNHFSFFVISLFSRKF
jgi:hypothetical protein